MADEIIVTGKLQTDGSEKITALYYWDLASQVLDDNSVPVIPVTDASGIGDAFADLMDPAQLAAIAAGDAIYHMRQSSELTRTVGESAGSFITRMQADRTGLMPYVEQQHRDKHAGVGNFDGRWAKVDG